MKSKSNGWLDKDSIDKTLGLFALFSIKSLDHIGHDLRQPVFGIYDQVGLKPACSATETS